METVRRWYSKCLSCVKLKTHKEEISLPSEIMEDILSRLPVKSILRFRSVSKPWLSIISAPSFTKLQLTRARTALLITAVDFSTDKKYFFSAGHDGGSFTHLMTLEPPRNDQLVKKGEHLNGLVCNLSMHEVNNNESFIVNPSTRKIFKLPDLTPGTKNAQYFFGFDESRNEHKILSILGAGSTTTHICSMIFCMSGYSWRWIDATVVISPHRGWSPILSSVCVNSVVHLLNDLTLEILTFDLRTEKFSIVKVPLDYVQRPVRGNFPMDDRVWDDPRFPYLIKINGCIGVVCHDRVVKTNQMHIWILQDYENRVWVKETITFPKSWITLGCPFPSDSVNMDEIIFSLSKRKLTRNVFSSHIYNMKSGCFRSVQFTLDHPLLCSQSIFFYEIKCYVESILPL